MDTADPFDQWPHPSAELPSKLSEYLSQLHPNLTSVISLLDRLNDRDSIVDKLNSLSEQECLRLSCGLLKLSSAGLSMHRVLFSETLAASSFSVARAHQEVIASHELHREKLAKLETGVDVLGTLTRALEGKECLSNVTPCPGLCNFECPNDTEVSPSNTLVNQAEELACGILSPPPTRPGPRRFKNMILDALRVEDNKLTASKASTSEGLEVRAGVSTLEDAGPSVALGHKGFQEKRGGRTPTKKRKRTVPSSPSVISDSEAENIPAVSYRAKKARYTK